MKPLIFKICYISKHKTSFRYIFLIKPHWNTEVIKKDNFRNERVHVHFQEAHRKIISIFSSRVPRSTSSGI